MSKDKDKDKDKDTLRVRSIQARYMAANKDYWWEYNRLSAAIKSAKQRPNNIESIAVLKAMLEKLKDESLTPEESRKLFKRGKHHWKATPELIERFCPQLTFENFREHILNGIKGTQFDYEAIRQQRIEKSASESTKYSDLSKQYDSGHTRKVGFQPSTEAFQPTEINTTMAKINVVLDKMTTTLSELQALVSSLRESIGSPNPRN